MQFPGNDDGDLITIYDIDLDGNTKLISRLSGPDLGPKLKETGSNWEKKVISGSSNKLMVEFKSDDTIEHTGFSLSIQFTPFQNDLCESCLDMKQKTLKSPNYPKSYGSNITCNWIITAQHGVYITLELQEFNVKYFVLIAKNLLALNTSGNYYIPKYQHSNKHVLNYQNISSLNFKYCSVTIFLKFLI